MTKLPNTFITIVTCDKPLDRHTADLLRGAVNVWRDDISQPLVLDEGAELHLYNLLTGQNWSTEQANGIELSESDLPTYLVPGRDPTLTSLPAGDKVQKGNLLNPQLNL